MIELFLLLLAAHWVCDYPLQGDFLASAKQKGPLRVYHLIAHSGIHAGAIMIVTGNAWLAVIEWIVHTVIDELKIRGVTNFAWDQVMHIVCKVIYVLVIGVMFS